MPPFTFNPSTAYGHVHQYLPGASDAVLIHRTVGGTPDPPDHNGVARHRTHTDSDYRQWSAAFVGVANTAAVDWFADQSDSRIATPGDVLEYQDKRWIVGQVNPGRWGSQQLLYVTEAVE